MYGLVISGNYAYLVGGGGLEVLSIADPANPVEIGSIVR
jgi:hypothetical protein